MTELIDGIVQWMDPSTFDWPRTIVAVVIGFALFTTFMSLRAYGELSINDVGNESERCWKHDAGHNDPEDDDE